MASTDHNHPLLVHIAARKIDLGRQWEDGILTTEECFCALDALCVEERAVYRQLDRAQIVHERVSIQRWVMALAVTIAFSSGFFVSPHLYSKLFGYRSAEECALDNSTRIGYAMCFELYESKRNMR